MWGLPEVVIINIKQPLVVGFIVFIAWLAASVVASFINGILFAFIPFSGGLALVGTIVAFLIFSLVLGFLVIWLVKQFA